jgi:hypothetical protein
MKNKPMPFYGLWKMPSLWKSASKRGFPQRLGKAFGFPTFPTGPAALFINCLDSMRGFIQY